jgi:uncharacterized protein YndB with AHSA1/START domain
MTHSVELSSAFKVPAERVWQAFTDPAELECWYTSRVKELELRPGGRFITVIDGIGEGGGQLTAVETGRLLAWTEEARFLPAPTEIEIELAAKPEGAHLTVTHSGFGDGGRWTGAYDTHALGWANHLSNLHLYLETGIAMARKITWKADFGAAFASTPAAPVMLGAAPGSCADQAGLRPGDLLITMAGAPVFTLSDVWLIVREHDANTGLDVTYVRDGEVRTGTGILGSP